MNAIPAWNNRAKSHHFELADSSTVTKTFLQAYQGQDFATDFQNILDQVAADLQTGTPDYSESDLLNFSLLNWPVA